MGTMSLRYDHKIRTRYMYPGPRKSGWATCHGVELYCYFSDLAALEVELRSNAGRLVGTCTYSQMRQSGISADNTLRHVIWIGSREGLDGNFFDVKTTKTIHESYDPWEYEGVNLAVEPIEHEYEFQDGTADLTGATTFVIEADVYESDAYA